uniref:Receptor like tyrosine kinase n=1 Tax=Salmo trutta TaxID=8032 RepID=A0A673ZMB4_SALTR
MLLGQQGLVRRCGNPSVCRGWPYSVQWRLGGLLFFLLLVERTVCLASSVPAPVTNNLHSVNVYMSEEEVKKLLGLDAELYYVRDDVVNHYALSFILPVPSETNSLHFTWRSKDKVEYRMGFHVDNPAAMNQPQSNISTQGEVPRTASVFRVDLFCSGKVDGEAILTVQLNLTIHSNNFTVLNFKRRKMCYKRIDSDPKITPVSNNKTIQRPEMSIPTTSTRVFYISVGVCCAVIFLVAIVLAVMHLHSMKRVELDDSVSDSGSSQGLSQPSTQTTQYLRADTPNNASAVTSYPSLRIEKNDLRSVSLLEAKAKVKDISISRLRVTLRDVLHEGTFGRIFHGVLLDEKDPAKEKYCFVKTVKDHASEMQVTMMLTESCKLRGLHHRNLLPISHVCTEEGEKPMVLLPYMNWGNLKLFLRQCKLAEANNPQENYSCASLIAAEAKKTLLAFNIKRVPCQYNSWTRLLPFFSHCAVSKQTGDWLNCSGELWFAVMACCWALDPEERPKFQQLVQCLTEFHAALGAYV